MRTADDIEAFEHEEFLSRVTKCKTCGGLGRMIPDLSKKCVCQKEVDRRVAYYEACIPRRFWDTKAADILPPLRALFDARIRPFIVNFKDVLDKGDGLYLCGENGVGKTMTASYAAKRIRVRGFSVYFTTAADLLEDMKRGFRDAELNERFRTLLESQLLVIDELGAETFKSEPSWSHHQIERVLKMRENECLPTIVVSNTPLEKTPTVYGRSVGSVLRGRYSEIWFESPKGDMRMKG